MRIICNTYIKKERDMYSSVCIELGIASCGYTIEEAYKNVIEAVEIHLNDARELGTLNELLAEAVGRLDRGNETQHNITIAKV